MKFWGMAAALLLVALAAGLNAFNSGEAAAQAVSTARLEGILNVIWGDPRAGASGGATLFTLATPDGTVHPLEIAPEQRNAAIASFGQRVAVFGRPQVPSAAAGRSAIQVDRLEALNPGPVPQAQLTTRRVLYILLKFKGNAQEPHPISFYKELTNPRNPPAGSVTPGTINGFFFATSYGNLQWSADVAGVGGLNPTRWFTLPKTKLEYANCGWSGVCADLDGIATAGMTLAKNAGVDLTVYSNINFVINDDLDCCAWGGSTVFAGKVYGATWEPPWSQEAGTYVHELGHSIGLPHSGWVYYAYDSPWDMMSGGSSAKTVQCGTYRSANSAAVEGISCTRPGGGYLASYKDVLGWIPAANQVVINAIGTKTVTLSAGATALGATIKMIKICLASAPCTGANAHYLTVEARINSYDYDKGLPGSGVIIHDFRKNRGPISGPCFFNDSSGWAVPIDRTRNDWRGSPNCDAGGRVYPNYALFNAQYLAGGTAYSNATWGVTVQVLSHPAASTFSVRVTRTK